MSGVDVRRPKKNTKKRRTCPVNLKKTSAIYLACLQYYLTPDIFLIYAGHAPDNAGVKIQIKSEITPDAAGQNACSKLGQNFPIRGRAQGYVVHLVIEVDHKYVNNHQ